MASARPTRSRGQAQRVTDRQRPGAAAAEAVRALVAAPLSDAGFDLESVTVTRASARHVVAVAVDRDGGVGLDAVAEASRVVSGVLDAGDDELPLALRGAYTLEVSSRGATVPLTAPRHWRRAVGRLVEVRLRGGDAVQPRTIVGRLTAAADDGADLDVGGAPTPVAYGEVVRAVVQLEFRGPPASGGADDDGTEDHIDEDDTDEQEAP